MGRRTLYDPDRHPFLAARYARDGCIDVEIAKRLGIVVSTLYVWKRKFPEFSEAIKVNKEIVDYEVEDSLLKRAKGFEYEETEIAVNEDGKKKHIKKIKKMVPPDVTAQIFWLKNRQKEKWRDTNHQEHTGKDGGPIEVSNLTPDQRQKRIKELLAKKGKQPC